MVIEIGFLRGCQLAHQDLKQRRAPRVKWGPYTNLSDWKPPSSKHGGTAFAHGELGSEGSDSDLHSMSVPFSCTFPLDTVRLAVRSP